MPAASITLDQAVDLARTGDVWLFRGHKMADRAIQVATNSPVNHVGMSVVIEDLPPLMWHAELGRSLPDVWAGARHRGVQLHDLRASVIVWAARYGQRAWLRQLDPVVTGEMEDAVLQTIARLDGTPFPSTAKLASRWLFGRVPTAGHLGRVPALGHLGRLPALGPLSRLPALGRLGSTEGGQVGSAEGGQGGSVNLETAYCAQLLALTYQAMGLLPDSRRPGSYDPGSFWSGDNLKLSAGFRLGGEIAVQLPAGETGVPRRPATG